MSERAEDAEDAVKMTEDAAAPIYRGGKRSAAKANTGQKRLRREVKALAIETTGRKHSHSRTKDVEMNGGDAIETNGAGLSRALRAKVALMLRSLRHLDCAWPFLDPVPVDQVRPCCKSHCKWPCAVYK